jgi:very-short-patch-repair endonuclease
MDQKIASIRDRLLKEREALLDLSTRNRLLNTPMRTRNVRTIEIVDEKPAEVFRLLSDGKGMTFLPGIQLSEEDRALLEADDKETGGIPQPTDDAVDERGVAARHTDLRLQTRLTSEGLQKRLFDIWYDAKTLEEEQGVNILYLAIGLLRWYEDESSDVVRHAPLVLLPVSLERSSAAERFQLKGRGEPPSPNITLQAKLKAEFGIVIEDFTDEDDLDLPTYIAKVAETVSAKSRWEVLPDAMVLGFYSFAKFLMYRDLDPDNWPETVAIKDHPLIAGLLRDGFPASEPIIADDAKVDDAIPPLELNHVVDADSSQAVAIAEAAAGRTLVIKGPPGTGKSQTITNVIAAAVARGRRVLFVSEKMAALDVVFRRLKQNGLGPLTFELHSNKINKRTVLDELKRTKEAGNPRVQDDLTVIERLGNAQGELTSHVERLHKPLCPCGLTPYQIVGRLVAASNSYQSEPFALVGATEWTKETAAQRRELAAEVSERLRELGPLAEHAWKGVRCEPLDPMERNTIQKNVQDLADALSTAISEAGVATRELGAPAATLLGQLSVAAHYFAIARSFPEGADREVFSLPAWADVPEKIGVIQRAGSNYIAASRPLDNVLNASGWKADFSAIRIAIVTKGGSLFRFLDGNYRAQIALLRSYLKNALPSKQADRIALIDSITAAQEAKAAFDKCSADGSVLLGKLWRGADTDWNVVGSLLAWRSSGSALPATFWQKFSMADQQAVASAGLRLDAKMEVLTRTISYLSEVLRLDWPRAFGCLSKEDISLELLQGRLAIWLERGEALTRYIAVYGRLQAFAGQGGGALVDALLDGRLAADKLPVVFDTAYSAVLRATLFSEWPELRAFDGDSHNRLVQKFRDLDRARIRLAREQIIARHAAGRPSSAGGIGPLGVLNAEMAKKRGHLPVRLLLDRAGPVIQQLKPVFMMSPLSVAQFLKPGGMKFDLLVMDEASQIEPVDALGAVARADQIVVVGDERQLPPTSFFKKLTGEEDRDSDDEGIAIQAKDAESILDLCLAKGVPHRMLSWHYRSKHQSLIAVSNREFYENKLYIVPSPYDTIAGMGLKFHLMKETAYDRGGTRTNPKEARIIAEAVMAHAKDTPDLSLGVATFSVAQRQAVLKELELLRRANPSLEEFFSASANEPFFVKNLENIQGDERDVILISVGYGKTAEGYLAHSFGPLSGEGGERRLNVLISRAKLRCEVFCNFTGADIDLERTRARGVAALKLFMTFAETGKFGLGESVGDEHDSEFEEQVCNRLRSLGYDVKAQIGASGFRVDLAISDPEKPGRFVLGIECDGAQYHSSRSARDRDRLRQQVLEAHGWIIHRIWSTDWYLRPDEELKKLETAIAGAKAEWRERDEQTVLRPKAVPLEFESEIQGDVQVVTAVMGDNSPKAAVEERLLYQEANFPVNASVDLHEVPVAQLANYIVQVVEIEGPVHLDEIATRLRTLWGLKKAGGRIRAVVAEAADVAIRRGQIGGEEFLFIPGAPVRIRDRSQVSSLGLRKPEMLPPSEVSEAMLAIVAENFGAKHDELIHACSRRFGYSSTSSQLKDLLSERIGDLIAAQKLMLQDGLLMISSD